MRERGYPVAGCAPAINEHFGAGANRTIERGIGRAPIRGELAHRQPVGLEARVNPDMIDRRGQGSALGQCAGAEPGLVAFIVDELAHAFLAAVIVKAVGGLLRADEIIFGVVITQHANAADSVLGRLQRDRIFAKEDIRDRSCAVLEGCSGQGFVDQAPFVAVRPSIFSPIIA